MKKIALLVLTLAILASFGIATAANRVSGSDLVIPDATTTPAPTVTTAPTVAPTSVPDPIIDIGSGIAGEPSDNSSSNPTNNNNIDYTVDNDYTAFM